MDGEAANEELFNDRNYFFGLLIYMLPLCVRRRSSELEPIFMIRQLASMSLGSVMGGGISLLDAAAIYVCPIVPHTRRKNLHNGKSRETEQRQSNLLSARPLMQY